MSRCGGATFRPGRRGRRRSRRRDRLLQLTHVVLRGGERTLRAVFVHVLAIDSGKRTQLDGSSLIDGGVPAEHAAGNALVDNDFVTGCADVIRVARVPAGRAGGDTEDEYERYEHEH